MDHVDNIRAQWRSERPDLETDAMGLLGRLRRAADASTREMQKTWDGHGLNAASFDVLATLRRAGPPYALSPGDLMASTMVTSGTMTNRIDQLQKAGLVTRTQSEQDRRSYLISLTDHGFKTIDAAVTDHVAAQTRIAENLSPADRRTLNRLLKTFLAGVESR